MRILLTAVLIFWAAMVSAQAWKEPARGSELRAALTDAVRPHVEWLLGAPVEFRVASMRVAGDLGFAILDPQRPGGGAIDLARSPMVLRDAWDLSMTDGIQVQVLYRKSGATWVALFWQIGATDVWYSWDAYCDAFYAVIPEACG